MSNAYGGIVNISFIVVFISIVSGFLAFSVSYNRAFRVKNKIISVIETNEGVTDTAKEDIKKYINDIHYNRGDLNIEGYQCLPECGFCYKKESVAYKNEKEGLRGKAYYKVVTAVNIDLPVLGHYLPQMKYFQVSGTTATVYDNGN